MSRFGKRADSPPGRDPEPVSSTLEQDPFGSPEIQARIDTITEFYGSLFHGIGVVVLEDGEEVIDIDHFFLTGDLRKHIEELATPFAVEFNFAEPPPELLGR